MLPDEGYRYLDTVYDDGWLAGAGHAGVPVPAGPVAVDRPADPAGPWTAYPWQRRTPAEVVDAVPARAGL